MGQSERKASYLGKLKFGREVAVTVPAKYEHLPLDGYLNIIACSTWASNSRLAGTQLELQNLTNYRRLR